jgi:hypothetical protein
MEKTTTNGLIYTCSLDASKLYYEVVINRPDATGAEIFHCGVEPSPDEADFLINDFINKENLRKAFEAKQKEAENDN